MTAGGYQRPGSPAPASGPGRLARRTDGGPAQKIRELPDSQYGEAATFRDLQQQAPLAATPPAPSGGSASGGPGTGGAGGLVGLGAPSTNPGQPVTAGAALGAGPGPEALGLPDPNVDLRARLWAAYQQFPNEDLREILEAMDEG